MGTNIAAWAAEAWGWLIQSQIIANFIAVRFFSEAEFQEIPKTT